MIARLWRVVLVAAVATTVAGCAAGPAPQPSGSASSAPSARPSESPAPSAPVLIPQGSASDNLPLFAAVTQSVWATSDRTAGRAYIDALAAAGFDKEAMQVTADLSTVGNPAESIQFAVLWDEECIVGQVGPATGEPYTVVVPKLAEGRCLVGETRPIDW